jgi:hypothetical protein
MSESKRGPTERLAALVGRWRTTGWANSGAGAAPLAIDAVDTYDWLPGRWALLHRVDARVGDERVEGAEIIGWDPDSGVYRTQYFGSDGPNSYEASLDDDAGTLVWRMQSRRNRFTGSFSRDRARIDGYWERVDDVGDWQRWMEISLTKSGG